MSIITPYIDNLEKIKNNLPEIASKAINENYSEIVMLVKSAQLGRGLNSRGEPLKWNEGTGKYAKRTQGYANRDGVRVPKTKGAPYNFSWTGETLDNTQLKQNPNESTYEIFTIAWKQRMLESQLGYGEIFKLTDKHNDYVNEKIILPAIYQHILKNLLSP